METIEEVKLRQKNSYVLLGLDHGIQVVLFWAILVCAITVYGLLVSALLMIPWGIIQVLSALYNSFDKWAHPVYRNYYTIYWILVGMVAVLFGTAGLACVTSRYCLVAGMVISAGIGCYHTYIIHCIYKRIY